MAGLTLIEAKPQYRLVTETSQHSSSSILTLSNQEYPSDEELLGQHQQYRSQEPSHLAVHLQKVVKLARVVKLIADAEAIEDPDLGLFCYKIAEFFLQDFLNLAVSGDQGTQTGSTQVTFCSDVQKIDRRAKWKV